MIEETETQIVYFAYSHGKDKNSTEDSAEMTFHKELSGGLIQVSTQKLAICNLHLKENLKFMFVPYFSFLFI